jgi:hypothetical protein
MIASETDKFNRPHKLIEFSLIRPDLFAHVGISLPIALRIIDSTARMSELAHLGMIALPITIFGHA